MNTSIDAGTPIHYGRQIGVIQQHFLDTGKVQIALNDGKIFTTSFKRLMEKYARDEVAFGDASTQTRKSCDSKPPFIDHNLSDAQRKQIARKQGYVNSCMRNQRVLDVHDCEISIREHALNTNDSRCPTTKTVRQWCQRYIASNGNPLALLDRNSKRGNRDAKLPECVFQ